MDNIVLVVAKGESGKAGLHLTGEAKKAGARTFIDSNNDFEKMYVIKS